MKKTGLLLLLSLGTFWNQAVFSSENYLEPPKKEAEKTSNKQEKKVVSKFLEAGEELQSRGQQLRKMEMEAQRIKTHLQVLQSQKDQERFAQTIQFYQQLLIKHEKESTLLKRDSAELIGKMKPLLEKRKLSRDEAILLGRLYLSLGKTQEMIQVYNKIRTEPGLNAEETLELATAYNSLNEMEEGIKVLNEALEKKLEFKKKSELQFLLAQNLFWMERMKDAIILLKELERFPETRTRASRFLISFDKTYRAYQKELEYRKSAKNLPRVEINTSRGLVLLELFEDDAPNAVSNFITLVENKYYDNQRFHRVIPNFMAQGGDPNSKDSDPSNDGKGGPGYAIKTEISKRNHFRGVISYANRGKDTDGSQFFLTVVPTFWLDGKHAVFGRVLEGLQVVDSLKKGDKIHSVKVLSKRDHPYTVKKL